MSQQQLDKDSSPTFQEVMEYLYRKDVKMATRYAATEGRGVRINDMAELQELFNNKTH